MICSFASVFCDFFFAVLNSRFIKGLVEAQRKELSKAVEDLKVEVAQRTHEIRRLTEELGDKSKQTGLELKDVRNLTLCYLTLCYG